MADNAMGHHVGAVADPRRVVTDGRGGQSEFFQIIKPANPAAVAANAGVVEDRRGGMKLHREVGGIDTAMGGIDDDCAGGFRPDAGDAVGDDDWSGHCCPSRVVTVSWHYADTSGGQQGRNRIADSLVARQ